MTEQQKLIELIEIEHNELMKLEKKVEQKKSKLQQLEFQLRQCLVS